jgi:hypothetical protein
MKLPTIVLAASLLIVRFAPAQSACPWLTDGTAAAALGGPAITAAQLHGDPNRPMGSCIFTRQGNAATSVLEIAVSGAPLEPGCPANSPKLTGIGNEASFCRLDTNPNHSPAQARYIINSRVRDLYFRVSLAIAPTPASQPLDHEREQIQLIAEQVAGSLY